MYLLRVSRNVIGLLLVERYQHFFVCDSDCMMMAIDPFDVVFIGCGGASVLLKEKRNTKKSGLET